MNFTEEQRQEMARLFRSHEREVWEARRNPQAVRDEIARLQELLAEAMNERRNN